ncbi:MAG TPA: SIMPL domain-containing protein, partial [Candidatus Limnocylindria bacterium]
MKALRATALVASVLCLAVLVSPAVASGPITSTTAAPAAEGAFVTAMGIGVAPVAASDPFAIGQTLYISVQQTADSAGLQNAADEMLSRLGAIKAALVDAGVPADGIRLQGLSVNPMFGPSKPGDAPGQKSQTQALTSVNLNGSLSADVPSIRLLIAAMNAATANGATQVNANSGKGGVPFGTVQPSATDLAKATGAAVANARTNAEALAAASGKKVGAIRSISSSQLPMMGCCLPNTGWTVQVTVTFEFA